MKRLVICSGKLNRLGYRTLPEGVVTSHYIKNPVLLGMHKSQMLSIGKVTNIRIETDGENKGMSKWFSLLMGVFVGGDYEKGLANIKKIAEAK